MDGTILLCEDLQVDPEDVVLLAVAYELKSPKVGEWNRKGWIEGWSRLGSVYLGTLAAGPMKINFTQLRHPWRNEGCSDAVAGEVGIRLDVFP